MTSTSGSLYAGGADRLIEYLAERLEILDAMERDTVKEHACAALLSGKSNLAIAGQTLQ